MGAKPRDSLVLDSARRGGTALTTALSRGCYAPIHGSLLLTWAVGLGSPVWRGCVTTDQECGLNIRVGVYPQGWGRARGPFGDFIVPSFTNGVLWEGLILDEWEGGPGEGEY